MTATREHSGPGWRIEIPDGVIGGPAKRMTNPELLSSSIFHYGVFTIAQAKEHIAAAGIPVRAISA